MPGGQGSATRHRDPRHSFQSKAVTQTPAPGVDGLISSQPAAGRVHRNAAIRRQMGIVEQLGRATGAKSLMLCRCGHIPLDRQMVRNALICGSAKCSGCCFP
jgi:hypothetical protein